MSEPAAIGDEETIGIVVIGRNESARLPECLASLSRYRDRIVYADSASTDRSPDIARQFGSRVVDLDPAIPLTPARGRNEGFAALLKYLPGCEFVQFVDGDSLVEPGWIDAGAAFLASNRKVAVACGQVAEAHPDSSIYNWLCNDEWRGSTGKVDACGGNAMIRVAAFQQVGGFRGDLVAGEEAELMARMRALGWEIWRLDAPMVVHDSDLHKFSDWWRRARRGGYSYANLWWLTKRAPVPLYAEQLRSSLFWVVGLPVLIALLSGILRSPAFLLALPIIWLMQVARIASRRGLSDPRSWSYAGLIMLAKVPEAIGALRYLAGSFRRGARSALQS